MIRIKNYLGTFFDRVMAEDTDILEAASGAAGVGFSLLMSDHDVNTFLRCHTHVSEVLFRASVILGAGGQLISVYFDDSRARRAGAFGAMIFWTYIAYILWDHQIIDSHYGKIGHPSSVAAYCAFAIGNMLAYVKLGRHDATA